MIKNKYVTVRKLMTTKLSPTSGGLSVRLAQACDLWLNGVITERELASYVDAFFTVLLTDYDAMNRTDMAIFPDFVADLLLKKVKFKNWEEYECFFMQMAFEMMAEEELSTMSQESRKHAFQEFIGKIDEAKNEHRKRIIQAE